MKKNVVFIVNIKEEKRLGRSQGYEYSVKSWKKWWIEYFDWNQDGKTNWWEYTIPFIIILIIEIIAEIIASWIF